MKIWLDDQSDILELERRHVPEGWVGAKNAKEFKRMIAEAIEKGEKVEAIDFDNDLGEPMEGKDLLKWLMREHPELAIKAEMNVHSANGEAAKILEGDIRDCKERPNEILEMKNRPSYEELFRGSDGKIK